MLKIVVYSLLFFLWDEEFDDSVYHHLIRLSRAFIEKRKENMHLYFSFRSVF